MIKGCKLGSVGFVALNVRIKVTDIETLTVNQSGELHLKLPCVMNGYYKRPEETKRIFDSDGMQLIEISNNQSRKSINNFNFNINYKTSR